MKRREKKPQLILRLPSTILFFKFSVLETDFQKNKSFFSLCTKAPVVAKVAKSIRGQSLGG